MARNLSKRLPHEIPSWVPDGETMFITVNCLHRGINSWANEQAFRGIQQAAEYYEDQCFWWVNLLMVMPDHTHGLISFNNGKRSMKDTVNLWKRYLTRNQGIDWQKDFFDHRIRNQDFYEEKAHYIRMNPVRAGLCEKPEDWPYVWQKQNS
ncbi:REP-associated tyrosine transposase [Cerasicoccus arenae]|uniref:REP-associated tyrosine transposase n=1 Tax=Cerasicoccus arenae TaxID=424488 RepID=UPI001678B037|nr:hypothetical protein [Cerasicoccus arenae]MBK1860000.1 hypothetical protein [Cerasicoccus arenae]